MRKKSLTTRQKYKLSDGAWYYIQERRDDRFLINKLHFLGLFMSLKMGEISHLILFHIELI